VRQEEFSRIEKRAMQDALSCAFAQHVEPRTIAQTAADSAEIASGMATFGTY
jgi:hypothetical protein